MSGCSIPCDGRCCAVFPYPNTPAELREREDRDSQFIADMLVPLTADEAYERMVKFGSFPIEFSNGWTPALVATAPNTSPLYTCRHWDEQTGMCGAYDERPQMCRDYPYASGCLHCGTRAPIDLIESYLQRWSDPDAKRGTGDSNASA